MSFFGGNKNPLRAAVLVDIGSGSVGVAVVLSDPALPHPEVLWSHREFALLRDITATADTIKHLNTALINAFLELGSSGLTQLKARDKKLVVRHVLATIAAPWSYTVTKQVTFTDDHPFTIDNDLIDELTESAQKQSTRSAKEAGLIDQGVEIINNATIHVTINGYMVHKIREVEGRTIALTHVTALAATPILNTLRDSIDKVLPRADVDIHSFMYLYYCALSNMHPDTSEVCLIDVTNEATEVGVVREGVLAHVTHGAYGTFTLAREIAEACNIPKEEAYTYLKGGESFVGAKLSKAKLDQLEAIVSAYELKIATILQETGDQLSIPKTVFLHTNTATEEFFKTHIKNACREATGGQHTVHVVTSKLLEDIKAKDSALVLAAKFYHDDLHCQLPELL